MGYDLYVIILEDDTWRFVPYAANPHHRCSSFYMKGSDFRALDLIKKDMNTDDSDIKSWEHVVHVADKDFIKVQDAMDLAFKMDMNRPQDTPNVFAMEEAVGDSGRVEKHGSWSQTFVILALKRLERDGVVPKGTVEDFKKKI